MLVTVAGSVGAIGLVSYVHAELPLLNALYNLQLPLCLFLFVIVKSVGRRCIAPTRAAQGSATLPEIYACMRVVVTEMYATFVVLLAVKLFMEARSVRGRPAARDSVRVARDGVLAARERMR